MSLLFYLLNFLAGWYNGIVKKLLANLWTTNDNNQNIHIPLNKQNILGSNVDKCNV